MNNLLWRGLAGSLKKENALKEAICKIVTLGWFITCSLHDYLMWDSLSNMDLSMLVLHQQVFNKHIGLPLKVWSYLGSYWSTFFCSSEHSADHDQWLCSFSRLFKSGMMDKMASSDAYMHAALCLWFLKWLIGCHLLIFPTLYRLLLDNI